MEDLGRIDININESGGGGSGTVGGGPQPSGLGPPSKRFMGQLQGLEKFSDALNELQAFRYNPSLAGAQALQQNNPIVQSLSRIGGVGRMVSSGLLAFGAAGGLATMALKALKEQIIRLNERVEEIYRYSGRLTAVVTSRRLREMQESMDEARRSGEQYAEVYSATTDVKIMGMRLKEYILNILGPTMMGVLNLVRIGMKVATIALAPFAYLMRLQTTIKNMMNNFGMGGLKNILPNLRRELRYDDPNSGVGRVVDVTKRFLEGTIVGLPKELRMIGVGLNQVIAFIRRIWEWLRDTFIGTSAATSLNDWFLDDLKVMTRSTP
jgi:hypothetical protein